MARYFLTVFVAILFQACASAPEIHPPAANDIFLGMPMERVKQAWGTPRRVEVAGNPELLNQRWIYPDGPFERFGSNARIIYFERGRVVGWEVAKTEY